MFWPSRTCPRDLKVSEFGRLSARLNVMRELPEGTALCHSTYT